ncbi:MAG: hypothetical protein HFG88_04300 [Dorea sp.]|nr:hypothetical protein [Dorea sp.]
MKKVVVLGAAGILTLVMGTSVFASGSAVVSPRSYGTGGLIGHHVEHFGGHYNHAGIPGCAYSGQFCWTSAGYSVGDRVTQAPAPTPSASSGQQSSGGQQAVYTQTYTPSSSSGYTSTGSYGAGQGYGSNYTDSNSNGVCDYYESGNSYGYGNGGYGYGHGGGHHGGGHHGGCRW